MKTAHFRFVSAAFVLGAAWFFPIAQAANLGSFHADSACEAYLSKNKKTNPDHIQSQPGTDYSVLALNKPTNPDYYQIEVPGAQGSAARWVSKTCGSFTAEGSAPEAPTTKPTSTPQPATSGAACQIAHHADSHVLALSWQPAFCQSHSEKTECGIDDAKVFQAHNFTLHGLWPNKRECGQKQGYYAYCCAVKDKPAGSFCDYPKVELSGSVREGLGVVMPSVSANSCLERHEWHKHGTCGDWSADAYFTLATKLDHEFNDSGVARFISERIGQSVDTAEFFKRVDQDLGAGASKKISLGCDRAGLLVDIAINLPAPLDPNGDLKALIAQGQPSPSTGNCGKRFKVDAIGQ